MFEIIENPSNEILDKLLLDVKNYAENCPDCGVKQNTKHKQGCDIARCLTCGGQYISCNCPEDDNSGYGDIWDGLWPLAQLSYDNKLVVRDTMNKKIMFDYNRATILHMKNKIGNNYD